MYHKEFVKYKLFFVCASDYVAFKDLKGSFDIKLHKRMRTRVNKLAFGVPHLINRDRSAGFGGGEELDSLADAEFVLLNELGKGGFLIVRNGCCKISLFG